MRWGAIGFTLAGAALVSGCAGAFDPQASQSRNIDGLWWVMLWLACAVFLVVTGLLVYALFRPRRTSVFERKARSGPLFIFIGGAVIPLLILCAVFGYSLDVVANAGSDSHDQLVVLIDAHQWWYDVSYQGQDVSVRNELHLPEHRQVKLLLRSGDVIHSFWVPELNGKMDIIPGITNQLYITDPAPGHYVGHCAEFCGIGHTTMDIDVVVEPEAAFEAWIAAHRGTGTGA